MHYEVFQNKKDKKWQWRIVDDNGDEIARSRIAYAHPGNCLSEMIRVGHVDPLKDMKQLSASA